MRAVVAYVTGAVLREIDTTPDLGGVPMNAYDSAIDPAEFPHVRELAPVLSEYDHESEFDFGLDLLISALELASPAR
jgi:hypothetical protein